MDHNPCADLPTPPLGPGEFRPKSKPRVVVVPGTVRSRNDNDRHFVGVAALARLYELRQGEYEIYHAHTRYPEGTIFLHPRYDGNYGRPEALG